MLYVAEDIHGAFIETFGRQLGARRLPIARVATRTFARVTQNRPLRLVDLVGPGLSRIGADSRLTTGDYDLSQRWALALHEHPDQPDGLLYRSRHDPSRLCAAIFDRAAGALTATSLGSLADANHTALLADLLNTYEYAVDRSLRLAGATSPSHRHATMASSDVVASADQVGARRGHRRPTDWLPALPSSASGLDGASVATATSRQQSRSSGRMGHGRARS